MLPRRTALAVLAILATLARLTAQAPPLSVERDSNRLRVSSPTFHFLTGAPFERLREGRAVTYVLTLSMRLQRDDSRGPRVTRQVIFSYDLWEERFSVSKVDDPRTSASHLTAAVAEAWCLDLLTLPLSSAPTDRTFVLELDCLARDDDSSSADTGSAATLTGLIDLLSRKSRAAPARWTVVSAPTRIGDLKERPATR